MTSQMPTKFVKAGDWRTLEWFWNSPATIGRFLSPAGAQIKVRYGDGWPFGKDRQKQTLDGQNVKQLSIGAWSIVVARMQIRVSSDTEVTYDLVLLGP